jgi:hypothetical protein
MNPLNQSITPKSQSDCAVRRPGVRSVTELMSEMHLDSRWDGRAWLLLAICASTILGLSLLLSR